jgi:ubiquinone/menaquinone biosynthesis C-methylase UbiE
MTNTYNPEKYWDQVAQQIDSREEVKLIAGDDEPYYRYKRKRFLEVLGSIDFSGKTVLEIGSGPGGNLEFIYNKGCSSITGVDISGQMVNLAKKNTAAKNIEVLKINGSELPFRDHHFDLVFTSTVLQHNTNEENLFQIVAEICRVSANEVILFERIEQSIKGHASNLGRPVAYYEKLMSENGFVLVKKKSLPIQASFFVCGIIRKLFNKSSRKEGAPLSSLSIFLEKITLPVTSVLDRFIPSHRDVLSLQFRRK